jgi:hypothetical protein
MTLPRERETSAVKNVQRNTRVDSRLGVYLIALVLIVIVLGYWVVIGGR